ncbi:MAG TPA: MFS transporter [Stellaceae bacterium]|jgi:MFS family permease|nr:MFS transporter [Stellaceae bacterium]
MTENTATTVRPAVPSAWLLLGGAFTSFTISAALMHSYPVYLVAYIEEFGWTRAETSIAYSVSQLVGGASSPFVGILVDRLGPRRLLLLGSLLLVLGLLGSAAAGALWQMIALYGVVMTIGANCLGLVVFVPILSRHFVRRRGMAISIVQSANGIARGISAPLVQLTISLIGWRSTYLVQAALMALVVLPLAAVFRRAEAKPQATPGNADIESVAFPGADPASNPAAAPAPGWTLGEAIRTPHFWLLFSVYMFTGLGSFFVSLHQLAFAVDVGFDKLYAAEVLGTGAFLAVPGIVVTGTLSDYLGREISAIMAYGFSIIGVVCALFITSPDQHLLLWLHACFFGLTWGARGPAITAKTADLFPGSHLGSILGVITIGSGLGAAIGSWGAGWIFDLSGSYRLAFILSIISYVCGVIAFWALRRPPVRRTVG